MEEEKMKYGKILTFKVEASDKEELRIFISTLKGFADGQTIIGGRRVNIAYMAEEACVDVKE